MYRSVRLSSLYLVRPLSVTSSYPHLISRGDRTTVTRLRIMMLSSPIPNQIDSILIQQMRFMWIAFVSNATCTSLGTCCRISGCYRIRSQGSTSAWHHPCFSSLRTRPSSKTAAAMERLLERVKDPKVGAAAAGVVCITAVAGYGVCRYLNSRIPTSPGPYQPHTLPGGAFDACIVGAGPGGSTAAYYMAQGGCKVVLLEKEKFPRDKYCGDAVCTPAIKILQEMGVMQELIENNEAQFADSGGFVSPHGHVYIGVWNLWARGFNIGASLHMNAR